MDDPWNFHQCKLCSYKSRYIHFILRHVRRHRKRPKDHRFACDLHSPEAYKCQSCEFQSDLKVLSTEHFDTVHKRKQTEHYSNLDLRSCKNCDFHTYSSLVLLKHDNCCKGSYLLVVKDKNNSVERGNESIHHTNEKGDDELIVWFKCKRLKAKKQCSYKTKSKYALHKHMLTRHGELKRHKCDWCPYETIRKKNLDDHMRRKHWFEWYQGPHMLRRRTKTRVQQPKELIKYFKCDQCSYKVKNNVALREHLFLKHTPTHIKSHSTSYQIIRKCELCSYTSTHKDDLGRHILTQHMESEDAQVFCEGVLISQKYTPAEEINCFKCELCSYKSKDKDDLGRHILRQHMEAEKAQVFYKGVVISLYSCNQ